MFKVLKPLKNKKNKQQMLAYPKTQKLSVKLF